MKYSIAILALFGLVSLGEIKQAQAVQHMNHNERLSFLNELIQEEESDSQSDSSSDTDDDEDIQLRVREPAGGPGPSSMPSKDTRNGVPPSYDEVEAFMDGSEANGGYTRLIPTEFVAERDDRLMHSLVTKYAREVVKNGKNTGELFCNKADALAVSTEVVGTHLGYKGDKAKAYLNGEGDDEENAIFNNTWNHFDVNKDGLIEVERMPQFLRFILGNSLEVNLQ